MDAWIQRRPWHALAVIGAFAALGYHVATRVPLYAPFEIHPTALDQAVPYLAWTVPIYLTYFATLPTFVALNRDRQRFAFMLRRAAVYIACNIVCTLVVPTQLVPWQVQEQTDFWAQLLRAYDSPLAAIPSGHVGLPCSLALSTCQLGGRGARLFAVWTGVMMVTVLTSKQHYAWDGPAGLLLAWSVSLPYNPRKWTVVKRRS